jgi:3-oxoadipate enol-lactonase
MEVVVGGRSIPYLLRGSRPNTIVFLPALGTQSSMWERQISVFSGTHTVIAPEFGGHDAGSQELTLASLADDLVRVLDAVGNTWVHVVGISMGGMVAQEFALRYPDRTRSLVLVNTASRYDQSARSALLERATTVEREGMASIADATIGRWFTAGFVKSGEPIVDRIRAMLRSANPATYAAAARAVADVNTFERLSQIDVPTLVVRGEQDVSMPPVASEELKDAIHGARMVTIPDAAHLLAVQSPEPFQDLLAPFLQAVDEDAEVKPDRAEPVHPW